ncbi:MAG: response regulator [Desulfobacteraceae bacterium]|nr:response regulator [Desulfobacteraceae bacterium]
MEILIAEDDITSRRILEAMLTHWGYDVISVSNGNDAVNRLLGDDPPKIALLNWIMPDKNGVDICQIIRQEETTAPPYIILITAKGDSKDITHGLNSGADDYMVKPYVKDELKARINVGQRMIELQRTLAEKEKFHGVLEMAGAVCHEMNQPLTVIMGLSEILLGDLPDDNSHADVLLKIKGQAFRLGEITKKLMSVTQYKTKKYLKRDIIDLDASSEKNNYLKVSMY